MTASQINHLKKQVEQARKAAEAAGLSEFIIRKLCEAEEALFEVWEEL